MYLSELKLWNFRKYGSNAPFNHKEANLTVPFKKGINVLIGENDVGKSAIIDSIRLVLGAHSLDWTKVTHDDFFKGSDRLRIELRFDGLIPAEAKNFTEWVGWIGTGTESVPYLNVFYEILRRGDRILPSDVRAGADIEGHSLNADAREYLRVTYLKPLRDAKAELVPRRNSRLSQILRGHEAFKGQSDNHHLVNLFRDFNTAVTQYFMGKNGDGTELTTDKRGEALKEEISKYLKSFIEDNASISIGVIDNDDLRTILETLGLSIVGIENPGLGTLNRMFMASELVQLKKNDWSGLRLALIEELEAHLHPQAQMKVIEGLRAAKDEQIILTTHSPNLASKVPLDSLIILNGKHAFPMGTARDGSQHTNLDPSDIDYLQWFLDVTKSNLFFAKGVLIVEGWAEEILLPALALKMKKDGLISQNLTEAGVSIVNVGGTAQLRYAKIFGRAAGPEIEVPIAVVTDVDVPVGELIPATTPQTEGATNKKAKHVYVPLPAADVISATAEKIASIKEKYNFQKIQAYIAPQWTLEYCLLKSSSLSAVFQIAVKQVHPDFDESCFEDSLAKKLLKKTFKKVEVAKLLAQTLLEDAKKSTTPCAPSGVEPPNTPASAASTIRIDLSDASISYLLGAIKYACRA